MNPVVLILTQIELLGHPRWTNSNSILADGNGAIRHGKASHNPDCRLASDNWAQRPSLQRWWRYGGFLDLGGIVARFRACSRTPDQVEEKMRIGRRSAGRPARGRSQPYEAVHHARNDCTLRGQGGRVGASRRHAVQWESVGKHVKAFPCVGEVSTCRSEELSICFVDGWTAAIKMLRGAFLDRLLGSWPDQQKAFDNRDI